MARIERYGGFDATKKEEEKKAKPIGEVLLEAAKQITTRVADKTVKAPLKTDDKRTIPDVFKKLFPPPEKDVKQVLPPFKGIIETFRDAQSSMEQKLRARVPEAYWLGKIDPDSESLDVFEKNKQEKIDNPNFDNARAVIKTDPSDARTLAAVNKLYSEPEEGKTDSDIAKEVAVDLVSIAVATGFGSPAAKEAKEYLKEMKKVYGDIPEIQELAEVLKEDVGILYDLDLESLPVGKIRDEILVLEQKLNAGQSEDEDWLVLYDREIDELIKSSEFNNLTQEQKVMIMKVKGRVNDRKESLINPKKTNTYVESQSNDPEEDSIQRSIRDLNNRRPQNEEFNRLSRFELTEDGIEELYEDPFGGVENLLRSVRKEFENANQESAQQIQQQISLFQDYITLRNTRENALTFLRRKKIDGVSYYDLLSQNGDGLVDQFVEQRMRDLEEVKDILNYRMGVMYSSYIISKTGDPESAKKILSGVGTKGMHHVLSQEGGMVDVVYQKYIEMLNEARRDKDGKLRRITAYTYKEVNEKLKNELLQEAELYNDMYRNTFGKGNDPLNKILPENEIEERNNKRKIKESDVESLMLLAEDVAVISQRDLLPLLRARKPLPIDQEPSSFIRDSNEMLIESMDLIRHMERYMRLNPGKKAMLRQASLMAANSTGIGRDVDHQIHEYMSRQGISKGSPEALEFLQEYFNENPGNLESFYSVDMKTGSRRSEKDIPKRWEDVSNDDLFYAIKTKVGESVLGGFPGHNDYFSSTWRIAEYIKQADQMYGQGEGHARGIAMGMRLRMAGADFLGAESHDDHHKAEHKIHDMWHEIAEFRPQTILDVMIDGKSKDAVEQFNIWRANGVFNGIKGVNGEPVQNASQLVEALSRRYRIINEKLAFNGVSPINYEHGHLNERQQAVVDEVTLALGDESSASFLNTMKEIGEWGSKQSHELTQIQYRDIYKTTLFLDDARIKELDNPLTALGSNTWGQNPSSAEILNISSRFARKGLGEHDVLVRSWGDAILGKEVPQMVFKALDPDKKKHLAAIESLLNVIPNLGGEKPLYRGAMYLSGGYMKLGTVKPLYDWLFLETAQKSAPMKEWFGPHAEVLGLGERHEMASDLALLLGGLPDDVAKESAEWFEDYLGLKRAVTRDGKVIRFSSWPYRIYKARLAALVIAGIIATAATAQAVQGITSSDDVKGGGGHGGGGHH